MTTQCRRRCFCDHLTRAFPAVVHIRAVPRIGGHVAQFKPFPFDQRPQHCARLAAQCGAERDRRVELVHHARDPDSLTAGVEVHLRLVGITDGLDGHRHDR